jgi:CBS domain-containing protein/RNA polymerase-binding transcription factor DksA
MIHQTTVKEFMSGDPVSIDPDASALEAYETMVRHGIRHLPVVGPSARVVGVVTTADLAAVLDLPQRSRRPLAVGEARAALEWRVGEVMTHAPVTLGRDASLAEAAERMADGRFGCLPVVDERGRLEGLLSETDLLYALANMVAGAELRERGKPHTLAGLVAQLERERARIAEQLDRYHAVERELSSDSHDRPMDLPERSAELHEVSLTAGLDALAARRLAALDRALDHARQGRLGRCDTCGGSISLPRLRALPGTTLCIGCARVAESGS